RRRHTRWPRDWSSDVCSSDLVALHLKLPGELSLDDAHRVASLVEQAITGAVPEVVSVQTHLEPLREPAFGAAPADADVEADTEKIGRASCRERGERSVGAGR